MVLVPLIVIGLVTVTVGLAAFQPWRLFTNVTVDEALPVAASTPVPGPPSTASTADPLASPEADQVAATEEAQPPSTDPVVLATGEFISHEHATSGTVRILELPDGTRVLRLEGLDTSNGPDLKVWLTDAPVIDGEDGWRVFDDGAYVDLGSLKGNKGNQNYPIPADVDLSDLTSLSIWCDRFDVSFGAAELAVA
jgi:hypothetical protein